MAGLRLYHLEPPGTRTGSYVAATFTEEVDLTGPASNKRVVALKALDAHQPWDTRVLDARCNIGLLIEVAVGVLDACRQIDLIAC